MLNTQCMQHSSATASCAALQVGATALGSTSQRWIQAPLAPTIGDAPRWELRGADSPEPLTRAPNPNPNPES